MTYDMKKHIFTSRVSNISHLQVKFMDSSIPLGGDMWSFPGLSLLDPLPQLSRHGPCSRVHPTWDPCRSRSRRRNLNHQHRDLVGMFSTIPVPPTWFTLRCQHASPENAHLEKAKHLNQTINLWLPWLMLVFGGVKCKESRIIGAYPSRNDHI